MKNDFTQKTKDLFRGVKICWVCGQMRNDQGHMPDAFHHILGRCSNSPLNLAPVHNFGCHLYNPELGTEEKKVELLTKTARYLQTKGYELDEKDEEFIENHNDLFKQVIPKI